jgi:Major Facilitator Superfamily
VFFVNAPIGVATFVFGAVALAGHTQPRPGRLDVPGLLLSGLGLGAAMYGVSEGPIRGWSGAGVLFPLILGAALLAAMVLVELRAKSPLVDLRLFGNRLFTAATSLYGLGSVAYLGSLYLAALFFQDALGLSALQAGLVTFPSALGVMAGGQIVTRLLYGRYGPRRIVTSGLLGVAAATVLMAQVGTGTNLWLVRLVMLGLGVGTSFVFIPAQAFSMAAVSKARIGRASSIFSAGKQLGGAVGVALLSTVLAAVGPDRRTGGHTTVDLSAFHAGFLAAAAVAAVAVTVALTINDADAGAAMAGVPRGSTAKRTSST